MSIPKLVFSVLFMDMNRINYIMSLFQKIQILPRSKKQWGRAVFLACLPIIILVGGGLMISGMPGKSFEGPLPPLGPEEKRLEKNLKEHVETLASKIGERNWFKPGKIEAAENYISERFQELGYTPHRLPFTAEQTEFANIEVEIPGINQPEEILIIGAHYDTAVGCPGANDNGSAVAAMLECARLFKEKEQAPSKTIRFVAFTNEEPPFFMTENMGSRVYARRCRQKNENIIGMIAFETIGYYSDEPGSQHYPFPLSLFYPDTGNFIAFVGNWNSRKLVREAINSFRNHASFPSEGAAAPEFLTGIGWSDHWAFWQEGYPGIMITDTALFRYPWYHTPEDTPDKLDYERLARVTSGLAKMIEEL
jgi:hypothetical protein